MSEDTEQKQEPVINKAASGKDAAPMDTSGKVDAPEVEQEFSKVATNPKQSIIILVGIVAVFLYLFFNLFIENGDKDTAKEPTPVPNNVAKPVQVSTETDIPSIPTLPAPPKLEDPTPPPPPPVETDATASDTPDKSLPSLPSAAKLPTTNTSNSDTVVPPFANAQQTDDTKKQLEAKRKSSIVLVSGTPPAKTQAQIQQETDFIYRGDMTLLLGRGKMIDAVIETAVSTDFGGEIRAIISRDVYAEQGKTILIPKGSRVFGSYATGTDGAYGRIAITWTRIDLATGYTLNLDGTGMDSLGRSGTQGRIDNKFKEQFANTVLRSAFNVTLARTLDSLVTPVTSTSATASATQLSTTLTNIVSSVLSNTTTYTDAGTQATAICSQAISAITDQTSTLYTTVYAACYTTTYSTNDAKLAAITSAINSGAATSVQTATTDSTPTQAQTATKQAYSDISDTVKTLVEDQQFSPTITIDQGTHIKIYVNKDYVFPADAIQ